MFPFQRLVLVIYSWTHLEDLLQLLVVLHHDDVGFAVVRHVLAGFWRVGGVDAHSEAPVRRKADTTGLANPAVTPCHPPICS